MNKTFLIWGCNSFSKKLFNLLILNNITILGFIDTTSEPEFCSQPVFTPHALKNQADFKNIPIILATPHLMIKEMPVIDCVSVFQFKKIFEEIINEHKVANPLLHPAALTDLLHLEFPNKIIPFGQPGSGIVLFAHLCSKIVELYPKRFKTRNKLALFFEKLCFEYSQIILQIVPDITSIHNTYNFHMSCWKLGTSYAVIPTEQEQIEIYAFATRNHIIGPVYNYHYIPNENSLKKLASQKYKLFFNMRNPLDVILSCLQKANAIHPETQEIDNLLFFDISRRLIQQLKDWLPLRSHLVNFSYDDLMENPIVEIKKLMKELNVRKSTRSAKRIWSTSSFKQLSSAPRNHFKGGGTNKWELFFNSKHLSFLKFLGIEEVLQHYHYIDTLNRFKQLTLNIDTTLWKSSASEDFINNAHISPVLFNGHEENDNTLSFLDTLSEESHFESSKHLLIKGDSQSQLIRKIKQSFDTPYVNRLTAAGNISIALQASE